MDNLHDSNKSMTTQTEALKLALEALEWATSCMSFEDFDDMPEALEELNKAHQAITIIKEALAQPEQEPTNLERHERNVQKFLGTQQTKEPEQEPVAWRAWFDADNSAKWLFTLWPEEEHPSFDWQPLYTHPHVPTAQPKEPLVINSQEKASEFIEKTLWEVIDVAAMFPKAKPDPRTWEHLMVYSPQPKEPEQEPVAWRNAAIRVGEDLCSVGPFGYYDMTAEQWLDWALSVVTVHAPPPQRKPLTDEQREVIAKGWRGRCWTLGDVIDAVEAAHDIGVNK